MKQIILFLGALLLAAKAAPAAQTSFDQGLPLGKQIANIVKNAVKIKPAYSGPLPGVWLMSEKIDAVNGIADWRRQIKKTVTKIVESDHWRDIGYTECRETSNLPGVIVCISYLAADLGHIFQRPGIYAEGGYTVGTGAFVKQDDLNVRKMDLLIDGQDLTSTDMKAFYDGMTSHFPPHSASTKGASLLLPRGRSINKWEQAFYSNVFDPISKTHDKFVVLAIACEDIDPYQVVLGHEMMHAQYFVDPNYRGAVEQYWSRMLDADKADVRKVLGENAYDPTDELLMRNEFQAYVLEPDAEHDTLKDFLPAHRGALVKAIQAAGASPIQIR